MRMQKKRRGLTLIELLVVLVVLAATAAMVVPKLGYVTDQANYAQSAATSGDVLSNLETFKTSTGSYPDYYESLLDDDDSQPSNFLAFTSSLSATTINTATYPNMYYPLLRAGIRNVYDLDNTKTDPAPMATSRAIANGEAVCTITSGSSWAKKIYPPDGTIPTGYQLVAFGIGPNCTAVGKTMATAPIHSQVAGKDQMGDGKTDYNRFIAVFEVKEGTAPGDAGACRLKVVLDANGYTIEQRVTEYKKVTP